MDLTAHQQAGFVFPVLKSAEIVQCMSELGFDLSQQELSEPARHKEKLRQVFVKLLDECVGKTEEDFEPTPGMLQRAGELKDTGGCSKLHETKENFGDCPFFISLRDCMSICGYDDFSWRDLQAPTAKRLRRQLSAIINLVKFQREQMNVYAELTEPRDQLVAAVDELNDENAKLNEQLLITEKESQDRFEEMKGVMQECEELELEIAKKNKLQSTARQEAAELKKTANDLKDALATSTWALQEADAKEEHLRSLVVSSPERRKNGLVMRQDMLDKEKQECNALEVQLLENEKKVRRMQEVAKNVMSAIADMEELHQIASKHAELNEKLEETLQLTSTNNKTTADTYKTIEEEERRLSRSEEKIAHQRKQHRLQINANRDALETAKSQLVLVEKDRRDGLARVEASEAEVRSMEVAMEQERIKTERDIECMISEYKRVEAIWLERNQQRMALVAQLQVGAV